MPRVTRDETTVEFVPESARLVVASGGRRLLAGRVTARFGGDTYPNPDSWTVTESDDGITVAYDDDARTTVTLAPANRAVDVEIAVENASEDGRQLGDLRPLAADETGFGPETRLYRHGYQSWTPTATIPHDEDFPAQEPDDVPMMQDLQAPDRTSHGHTALVGDSEVTLGVLDHSEYVARFDFESTGNGPTVTAVCPGDGVTVAPGERVASAPLRIDASRAVDDALASLAAAVGERMDARSVAWTPTGWCSWYHYYTGVTAADVRENRRHLAEWGPGIDVVQVDDGYQTAFGDWRTLTADFEDMAALADDIADSARPGLWLAPFFVQEDADLVADHPEWLVTADGEPVSAGVRHGEMYGLDTTHPGVQEWIRETVGEIVDWGYSYLKLDFLYAAALPGERYADVTRAEAYRQGLACIREAAGEETYLLGCGALQGQSVGYVDAMRVGPDVAGWWDRDGAPMSKPAVENAVRNTLNRQYLHRRWWHNDPDCQLVRGTTDLTLAERRSFAAVVALTGGSNFISDDLAELDDAGRELIERTLPPVENGTVEGLGRQETPDRLVCEREVDGGHAVAAFNLADEPRTLGVDLPADERGWDVWAEEPVPAGGTVEREVPAHGSLLVHAAPARDRPHVVGARHLAAATDQLDAIAWDASEGRLTIETTVAVELVVAVPDGWTHPEGDHVHVVTDGEPTRISFERA